VGFIRSDTVVGRKRVLFIGRDAQGNDNICHINKYSADDFRRNKVLVVYLHLEGETNIPELISELGYIVLDARDQSVTLGPHASQATPVPASVTALPAEPEPESETAAAAPELTPAPTVVSDGCPAGTETARAPESDVASSPLKIFYANIGGTDFTGMPKGQRSGLHVIQCYWSNVIEAEAPDVIVLIEMSSQSAVRYIKGKDYKLYGGIKTTKGSHRVKVFVRRSETSESVDPTFYWTAVRVRDINIIGVHLPHKHRHGPLPKGLIAVMEENSPYIVIGDFNYAKKFLDEHDPVNYANIDNAFVKGLDLESQKIQGNIVKEKRTKHSMITVTVSVHSTETNPDGV